MTKDDFGRVAILYPGDYETRQKATPDNNRLAPVFGALAELGVPAEPAVYHDEYCDEARRQLLQVDAVLVWMNPIQDGRDRSILDPMLRDVAAAGIYVSTHPDIISKMGTKEVLYRTQEIGWGCDTHLYRNMEQMRKELPGRLAAGEARVLKQNRGNGGLGVWRVQALESGPTPESQELKRKVEQEWVPAMQELLDIDTTSLPILWDCDFLFGPKNALGEDTHVLCEINVSSVAPFPESAPPFIAEAALARVNAVKIED